MSAVNPANERIKRRYCEYLREAEGLVPATIDSAMRAIADWDLLFAHADYRSFSAAQAKRYKLHVANDAGRRADGLRGSSAITRCRQVQKFFRWLAEQPGYRSQVQHRDVAYLNPSRRDRQLANARDTKSAPTLEQVQHVIRTLPCDTAVQRRDRAIIACALLTGTRVDALRTLKLRHVRTDRTGLDQDARDVRTKFSKSFPTFWFPVGDDILAFLLDYVGYLRRELLFGDQDPLFPSTACTVGPDLKFAYGGLSRSHWKTPDPIRRVFEKAFEASGLPYFSPHTIRNSLATLGERLCANPEAFKAWSQNMAHEKELTTFGYGPVSRRRQREILEQLGTATVEDDQLAQVHGMILELCRKQGVPLPGGSSNEGHSSESPKTPEASDEEDGE